MNLDQFLDLFFRSNVLVIEVLFGIVLVGIIFLTYRSFSRPETLSSDASLQGLEAGIKKILENYAPGSNAPASVPADVPSSEGGDGNGIMEEMATQIERLKLQLMQKNEEVEQLKSTAATQTVSPLDPAHFQEPGSEPAVVAPPSSGSSEGAGDSAALEEKLKDLEARLNEYSIIEDDIADLSFYKEETVRLQSEVDRLKAKLAEYEAGGAPVPETIPAPVAAAPAVNEIEESVVDAAPIEEVAQVSADSEMSTVDDDIMAEFERAVAEQKAMTASQKIATEVPPPTEEEASSPENAPVEGGINLDKMLSEVDQLPDQVTEEPMNVLEQALDTDKLLEEATGMEKIDSEALDEFDQFLKKEGA